MNGKRIATIICWCVSALALLGFAAWLLIARPFNMPFGINFNSGFNIENLSGPFQVVETHRVTTDAIDSFNINWVAGEVTIMTHDGDGIVITESAQRALDDNELMTVNTTGNTVTINFVERRDAPRRMPPKRLEVLIPAELSQNLDSFEIDSTAAAVNMSSISARLVDASSVSGSLQISNVSASILRADSTSGAVNLSELKTDNINVNTVSGAITLRETQATSVTARTTSGAINLSSVQAEDLDTGSVSGAHTLSGAFTNADINSTSGLVAFTSTILPSSFSASTISGAVSITVPNEGAISVSHSSVSGRLSSEIPMLMQTGGAQFRISTTSGSVNIYELT